MLDDVFSGLDADTEEHIFNKVFGPEGMLRRLGTTVILVTHAGMCCSIWDVTSDPFLKSTVYRTVIMWWSLIMER